MKNLFLALGAVSLAATPVLGQSMLPATPVQEGSDLGEGGAGIIAGLLAAGIAAIAIIAVADDDDEGVSP